MGVTQVRIGINGVFHGPFPEILQMCNAVEDGGLDLIGVSDSPLAAKELYVLSTYCALNTSRVQVISAVTNPVTRHPSVAASGLFALDQLAPGRISLGIGTGNSALTAVGIKGIATVDHLRQYVRAVGGILRGEEVEYRDRSFKSQWRDWSGPSKIPIYVACSGAKVLRMASQEADGLILSMGYDPGNIQYIRNIINEACREVGRDIDDLDVWWTTAPNFSSTVEEGMKTNLGVNLGYMTMGSMEGKLIPKEFRGVLVQLAREEREFSSTSQAGNPGTMTVQRAKELGIYDWLLTYSPRLWGTPQDITRRLENLADMGLRNWLFTVGRAVPDKLDFLRKLSNEVLPNFR